MVSKDQSIGAAIFLVCLIVAIFYVVTLFYPAWLGLTDLGAVQFWIIAIPVFVAFVAIMAIGAWIGWTMATTPPPNPIEEITSEIEENKTKEETPKPTESTTPTETPSETPSESTAAPMEEPKSEPEKKPERRRRAEKQQ